MAGAAGGARLGVPCSAAEQACSLRPQDYTYGAFPSAAVLARLQRQLCTPSEAPSTAGCTAGSLTGAFGPQQPPCQPWVQQPPLAFAARPAAALPRSSIVRACCLKPRGCAAARGADTKNPTCPLARSSLHPCAIGRQGSQLRAAHRRSPPASPCPQARRPAPPPPPLLPPLLPRRPLMPPS